MSSSQKSLAVGLLFSMLCLGVLAQPPAGIAQHQRVDLNGTLQVFIRENLHTHSSELEYFLDRGNANPPVKLVFMGTKPSKLRSGIGISVRGVARAGKFEVEAANLAGDGTATDSSPPSPAAAASVDNRSAAVIVLNLNDLNHSASDQNSMPEYYFGNSHSMKDMYEKISFGQMMIAGSVVAVVNSPRSQSQICSNPFTYVNEFLTQAEQQNPNFNRNNYRHRIFAIPQNASCGWTGYANVGCGSSCSAFNRWSQDVNTTAHEFGHNLGMAHAGNGSNQYADFSSFMGYSLSYGVRALDGAHHWQMGWYENLDNQTVSTVTNSGTYQVAPLREVIPSVAAASILRIDVGSGNPYFLSTRQAAGYDSDLPSVNSAALNGVSIHRYAGSGYGPTDLISQLGNGGSFMDSTNSLVISQLGQAADGTVTVSVELGEGECIEQPASLAMSPTFATVAPGEDKVFSVSVSNNDSSNCSDGQFALSASQGYFDNTSLTVPAGGQRSANLTISAGNSSADIDFSVYLAAENLSTSGTLTVDATPPAEVSNLTGSYQKKGNNHRIQLNWSGSSSGDTLGYEILRNGTVIADTVQTGYTDSLSGSISASYLYTIKAVDQVGNTSNGTSITVSTGSSGDTGGGGKGGGSGKGGGRGKKSG